MPGQGRKHLQLVGIGFVDTYRGEFRMWKYLQFASIGTADAWSGLEASAICWYWICRCLSWVRKHLQFAGFEFADTYRGEFRMWKYLQFAGIGFVDAWSGLEASTACWY